MLGQVADHRFTKAHASAYLDDDLSPAEHERVARHASICPKCHALLATLRRMLEALPGLAGGHPRPGLADGVLDRLHRHG